MWGGGQSGGGHCLNRFQSIVNLSIEIWTGPSGLSGAGEDAVQRLREPLEWSSPRVGEVWTMLDEAIGSRLATLIATGCLVGHCLVGAFYVPWGPDEWGFTPGGGWFSSQSFYLVMQRDVAGETCPFEGSQPRWSWRFRMAGKPFEFLDWAVCLVSWGFCSSRLEFLRSSRDPADIGVLSLVQCGYLTVMCFCFLSLMRGW